MQTTLHDETASASTEMQPIDRLLAAFLIVSRRLNAQSATQQIASLRFPSIPAVDTTIRSVAAESVSVVFNDGDVEQVEVAAAGSGIDNEETNSFIAKARESALTVSEVSTERERAVLAQALLGNALRFLRADVYGEAEVHDDMLADNAAMFGAKGKEAVLAFKRAWLQPSQINYDVDAVHEIDLHNRVVVASFQSLIPGKEGRGTDIIKFDSALRVVGVEAVRHHKSDFGH